MRSFVTALSDTADRVKAIEAGDCDVALANSYYLGRLLSTNPDFPVALSWPEQGSTGAHVNAATAGVATHAAHPAAAVIGTLRAAAGDLLEDVRTFDVFRSEALGEGRRSVAFALRFRSPERTLTDTEVGEARAACIAAVTEAHAAELR